MLKLTVQQAFWRLIDMPKPPTMQHGARDDFQTPSFALRPLLPHLPKDAYIWECASGKDNLTYAFEQLGYWIHGSDILDMADFLDPNSLGYPTSLIENFTHIITNPPYSLKMQFLQECYRLNKPFALLLPLNTLGTFKRQQLLSLGIEIIFMGGRIHFETPSGEGSGLWQETAWFTHGLNLPYQLNFPDKPIDRTPLVSSPSALTVVTTQHLMP